MEIYQLPLYSTGLRKSYHKFNLHLFCQRVDSFENEKSIEQIFNFLLYVESNHIYDPKDIDKLWIESYIAYLKSTIENDQVIDIISAIKKYLDYLKVIEDILIEPNLTIE